MAKNPPIDDEYRRWAVRYRSQEKREPDASRFIDQNSNSTPFKGVRRER